MIFRKHHKLTYEIHLERKTLATAMNEFATLLQYGSPSVRTWERACQASLRASRRRRGLPSFVSPDGYVKVDALATETMRQEKARLNAQT